MVPKGRLGRVQDREIDMELASGQDLGAKVLVIDDDLDHQHILCNTLQHEGFSPLGCLTAREALRHAREGEFAVAIVDLHLPDIEGIELLQRLRSLDETARVIIHTGHSSFDTARASVNFGAFAYIEKPSDLSELIRHVHRAVQTRMHEALTRSEERYKTLAELEMMKTDFISIVNHELRTPLTSIRGSLGLLAGGVAGELPRQASELVGVAMRNCERLSWIIDDMLDLAKMESAGMELDTHRCELKPLLEQAIHHHQPYADQYNVQFALDDQAGPAWLNIDPARFEQVMANLLSNAAKYSPADGEVVVSTARLERGLLRVAVHDHGPGIPDELVPHVFDKFVRAEPLSGRKGTGLGLSIGKALVEAMGGTIGLETRAGEGTTFHIDFPETESDFETEAPAPS